MRKAIIAFGLPNAGKTTFCKRFAREKNYSYVCPDSPINLPLPSDQIAQQQADREIVIHLQYGHDIIIEVAAASRFTFRRDFIKWLREKGVKEIKGFYFPIDLALAKERNSQREEPRPYSTIEEWDKELQDHPPVLEDGFDFFEIK